MSEHDRGSRAGHGGAPKDGDGIGLGTGLALGAVGLGLYGVGYVICRWALEWSVGRSLAMAPLVLIATVLVFWLLGVLFG